MTLYINYRKNLGLLFIFFSLIPWVSFGTNNMDSQVWPIISCLFFLLGCLSVRFRTRLLFLFLIFPIFIVSFAYQSGAIDFTFLRALVSYSTFSLVLFGFYIYLVSYGFPTRLFVAVNILYLLVAFSQFIVDAELFSFLLDVRTTEGRGVTGLTPEPTYFGLFLFFISWIYLVSCDYQPGKGIKSLIALNFIAAIFLAMSSMTIIFIIVAGLVYSLYKLSLKNICLILCIGIILIFGFEYFFQDSRVYTLYRLLTDEGFLIVLADASVNERVAHVAFSIQGWVLNDFLPGGFHSFIYMSENLYSEYADIFWYGAPTNRIMSLFGAFIYELGFLGLVYLLIIIFMCFDFTFKRSLELLLILIYMNSAIPLAFPLIPILLALFIYTKKWSYSYKQAPPVESYS